MKSELTKSSQTPLLLERGQVWKLKDKCLEIKSVGKHLVEFLITQQERNPKPQEPIRVGKHLESIQAVQKFLRAHRAVLEGHHA